MGFAAGMSQVWADAPEAPADKALPPIQTVTIGPNNEFLVNGKPFIPLAVWLQKPDILPKLKAIGINTDSGYWREKDGSGWLGSEDKFGEAVWQQGLYYIPGYDNQHPDEIARIKGAPYLLAWMHGDEPDLPKDACAVKITADNLFINPDAPLVNMVDGNPKTSSVLCPIVGAQVTIHYPKPATITRLALANGPDGAKVSDFDVLSGGQVICHGTLPNTEAVTSFDLAKPTTVQELTLKVISVHDSTDGKPNPNWGKVAGIDGFDASGASVLQYPIGKQPQTSPEELRKTYDDFKKFDSTRPILVTFCSQYLRDLYDKGWYTTAQADAMYPHYVGTADDYGVDIYPIFGWNQPENIDWVSKAARQERQLVGPNKPIYQWIETCTGNYGANAKPVTGVEIRNEVYQALASGCTAIGYFTAVFAPQFSSFAVTPENQEALKKINAEVTALTPQLLAPEAKQQPVFTIDGGLESLAHATSDGTRTTVIALNLDGKYRSGSGTIQLPGLKAGTEITVYGESRVIKAEDSQWKDNFAPLAVHIYLINNAPSTGDVPSGPTLPHAEKVSSIPEFGITWTFDTLQIGQVCQR